MNIQEQLIDYLLYFGPNLSSQLCLVWAIWRHIVIKIGKPIFDNNFTLWPTTQIIYVPEKYTWRNSDIGYILTTYIFPNLYFLYTTVFSVLVAAGTIFLCVKKPSIIGLMRLLFQVRLLLDLKKWIYMRWKFFQTESLHYC